MVPDGNGGTRGTDSARRRSDAPLTLRNEGRDRDRTSEANRCCDRRRRWSRSRRGRLRALGAHRQSIRFEADDNRAVAIGAQHAGTRRREPIEGDAGRVTVWIAGTRRGDGDRGTNRIDERLGRRGPAAVVGDLEELHAWQPRREELRVDRLLDVAHQEEPPDADLAEEHDRHVVDPGPAVGWLGRHLAAAGPQGAERDLIDGQVVTGGDPRMDRRTAVSQLVQPRRIPGTGSAHAGLHDTRDAIALDQQSETGDVILVRMRQHDRIDPPIPRWDALVESHEQPVEIRSSVDQEPAPARAFDEDRVALPDIEDGHRRDAPRPIHHDATRDRDRGDERKDGRTPGATADIGSTRRVPAAGTRPIGRP